MAIVNDCRANLRGVPERLPRRIRRTAPRWPLLENGKDPSSLDARIAFHLHRLRLTGKKLRGCGFCRSYLVPDITQARMAFNDRTAAQLATALGIDARELTRQLTEAESLEWAYYRVASANAEEVWQRAWQLWRHRLSNSEAARIMRMERSAVVRNLKPGKPRGYRVLSFQAALRLTLSLGVAEGPDVFTQGLRARIASPRP